MARQTDRYIRFYTDGSAARKMETSKPAAKPKLPKAKKKKKIVLYVDPIAILGIMTAAVILVVMTVSMVMLHNAQNEALAMEQRVVELQAENDALQAEYESGYDLAEVEKTALALGMVPKEQVEHVTLYVQAPAEDQTVGAWGQIWAFLTGLFA